MSEAAEKSLVAAMLAHPHFIAEIPPSLTKEHFSHSYYARLFRLMQEMNSSGQSVSPPSLAAKLTPEDTIDTAENLHILAAQGVIEKGADSAAIVETEGNKRLYVNVVYENITRLMRDDKTTVHDLIGSISGIKTPEDNIVSRKTIEQVIKEVAEREGIEKGKNLTPTGFKCMDTALAGGLYSGKLYVVAARAKVGKTMLMAQIAGNIAKSASPTPYLYLCLESSDVEIVSRIAAADLNVNATKLLIPNKEMAGELRGQAESYKGVPAYFENAAGVSLNQLIAMISNSVAKQGIRGVFIDYLQIIDGDGNNVDNRAAFISKVSQALSRLVKRHNIWIFTAVQRNRTGQVRESDGPLMEADMVMEMTSHPNPNMPGEMGILIDINHSRYTRHTWIGNLDTKEPSLILRDDIGPKIQEVQ